MPSVKIEEICGNPTVDGKNSSALTVSEYQAALSEIVSPSYQPMEGYIVIGRGAEPWLLQLKEDGKSSRDAHRVREVIDCQTMYSTANAGHGNTNILDPFTYYMEKTWAPTGNGITNHLQLPAAEALRALTGLNARVMTKVGGAEAVETAIKTARRVWWARRGKPTEEMNQRGPYIVVAENSFHGRTLGVTSFFPRESSSRKGFGPFPNGTLWVPFNDIDALYQILHLRPDIAGVLLEPIQGEGGIIIPADDYLPQVEKICHEHGVVFILDEIQTGFGRTGKNFAFEHYGVTPDILLLAKALGGGAIPASAIIGRKDVVFGNDPKKYDLLSYLAEDGPGEEGSTWSGAALVCMAILAAIKELCDKNLAEAAARNGAQFIVELKALQEKYPWAITAVRGKGLMVGVDFTISGHTVSKKLLEEGVWASHTGKEKRTLRFLPPLATPPSVLSEVVERLHNVLRNWNL